MRDEEFSELEECLYTVTMMAEVLNALYRRETGRNYHSPMVLDNTRSKGGENDGRNMVQAGRA